MNDYFGIYFVFKEVFVGMVWEGVGILLYINLLLVVWSRGGNEVGRR